MRPGPDSAEVANDGAASLVRSASGLLFALLAMRRRERQQSSRDLTECLGIRAVDLSRLRKGALEPGTLNAAARERIAEYLGLPVRTVEVMTGARPPATLSGLQMILAKRLPS